MEDQRVERRLVHSRPQWASFQANGGVQHLQHIQRPVLNPVEVCDLVCKVMLLGDSGVGKTCLLVRFRDDLFLSGNFISTVGIDFRNKVVSVDETKVKLQIWDTAGQERFRSVTHAYYRDAHALLLLYDVTNKTSFDNIRAWLGEIREYAQDDVVIMLLGNKADCHSSERMIRREDGERLAKEYNVTFMETSAKTGLNVELAFMAIASDSESVSMASVFCLPDELLLKVFSYLDVYDVALSVSAVCHRWNQLAADGLLWNGLELRVDRTSPLSGVLSLLPQLPHLRRVSLHWRTDTAELLTAISTHCPQLIAVSMVCCGFIDLTSLQQLFQRCPLRALSLGKSWAVPSHCLDDIALFTQLTTLNLSHSLLTPQQFLLISLNCTKLTCVNIDFVRGISEESLAQFIALRKDRLKSLSVFGELLSDNIFQHISNCFSLKLLHISTCRNFTDICFERIDSLKTLRSLTMRKAIKLSSQKLYRFYLESSTVKTLSHLYISAKRTVIIKDIKIWLKVNPTIDECLIDQYCTCILTKSGFTIYQNKI